MYGEVLFFAYWHPYWKCTNMLLQEELDFVLENPYNSLQVTFVCNAVQDDFGNPRLKIHKTKCPNLIRDMVEVIWEDSERRAVKKIMKREDPYFFRTHAADAAMSIVNREWPTRSELSRMTEEEQDFERKRDDTKDRKKRKKKLLGLLG
jgi:hypothetical protein